MRILAIESSCDETAVAVVENGTTVLSNIISSSREEFADMGGVVPEEAARRQLEYILPTLHKALQRATVTPNDIDAIAATKGPGLLVSLLVGTTTARTLASVWGKPLIGIDHTLGHLSSIWLEQEEEITFPVLSLSISGGHTDLWYRTSHTSGEKIGQTRDDAVGEAFDKGAAMLGLSYPGGPAIAAAAETGDPSAYAFPRPLHNDDTLDWSFSGLKTALKYTLRDEDAPSTADVAASYEYGLCQHLLQKLLAAAERYPDVAEIHVVGGVSANTRLRSMLAKALPKHRIRFPKRLSYCTDNAAMIGAAAAFLHAEQGERVLADF